MKLHELHSNPAFTLPEQPEAGTESPRSTLAAGDKVYAYRLAGGDEVRSATPAVQNLLQQGIAKINGTKDAYAGLKVEISSEGHITATNDQLLQSQELAVATAATVPTPEKARAIAERFIAAVQGLIGNVQAGAKISPAVTGPLPDILKGKLEYLNTEQVNAKGIDRPHHWRVYFRQTLPVAPDRDVYAPVSAGQCVVLVGGIPGSRSGGVLGMESSLVAVRETAESATLQYGSAQPTTSEPVDYASTELIPEMFAEAQPTEKQPDMVYKVVQGGVLAPFWLMTDGEKAATEEGVGEKNNNFIEMILSTVNKSDKFMNFKNEILPDDLQIYMNDWSVQLGATYTGGIAQFTNKTIVIDKDFETIEMGLDQAVFIYLFEYINASQVSTFFSLLANQANRGYHYKPHELVYQGDEVLRNTDGDYRIGDQVHNSFNFWLKNLRYFISRLGVIEYNSSYFANLFFQELKNNNYISKNVKIKQIHDESDPKWFLEVFVPTLELEGTTTDWEYNTVRLDRIFQSEENEFNLGNFDKVGENMIWASSRHVQEYAYLYRNLHDGQFFYLLSTFNINSKKLDSLISLSKVNFPEKK